MLPPAEVDPLGHRTSYTYSADDALQAVFAHPATLYDADGRQTATIDPLGNRSSLAYDSRGNVIRTENPLGQITTSVYDAAGRQVASVDPLENRTSFG